MPDSSPSRYSNAPYLYGPNVNEPLFSLGRFSPETVTTRCFVVSALKGRLSADEVDELLNVGSLKANLFHN